MQIYNLGVDIKPTSLATFEYNVINAPRTSGDYTVDLRKVAEDRRTHLNHRPQDTAARAQVTVANIAHLVW